MEIPEIVSPDMMDSQDETLQNPYYTCCSDATHNSILERDTSITNATKNVIPITSVHTLIFREKFIPEKKDSISALHRPNAPPDPSEYISLIGSSVKNLN